MTIQTTQTVTSDSFVLGRYALRAKLLRFLLKNTENCFRRLPTGITPTIRHVVRVDAKLSAFTDAT